MDNFNSRGIEDYYWGIGKQKEYQILVRMNQQTLDNYDSLQKTV